MSTNRSRLISFTMVFTLLVLILRTYFPSAQPSQGPITVSPPVAPAILNMDLRNLPVGQPEQFFQALRSLLTERHTLNQLRHNAWSRTANLSFHSWDTTYRSFLQALSG